MKKLFVILSAVFLCILSACGKKEAETTENVQKQYREIPTIFRYEEEYCPLEIVGFCGDTYHFYQREDWEEDGKAYWRITFYKQALSKEAQPEPVGVVLDNPFLMSSYLSEDGMLYLLLMQEEEYSRTYQILGYDSQGSRTEEIKLSEKDFEKESILKFLPAKSGSLYVLTKKNLFLVDRDGSVKQSYPCKGEAFRGICELTEDSIAVTYTEKGTENCQLVLLKEGDSGFSKSIPIKGNGELLWKQGQDIFFMDAAGVYALNTQTGEVLEEMSLKGRNISIEQTVDAKKLADGFAFLGYAADRNAVKYVEFILAENVQEENTDSSGRRYISLYDYSFDNMNHVMLERIIEAYNEQSDAYQVELRDYEYAYMNEEEFDPLKIIATQEFPDIIFSADNTLMNVFLDNQCLEDLIPYIESSGKISFSDLAEPVKNAYYVDGKMFMIPRMFHLTSIMGAESQMGTPGWTVEEFLQWLEEHPDRNAYMNLSRRGVFDICLDTVIESCLDEDSGRIDLEGESFKHFVAKIKSLELPETAGKPNFESEIDVKSGYITEAGIDNLSRTAMGDDLLGEEIVYKGYPSTDGTPKTYLQAYTLSIFSSSQVKEGAYDFVEFFLTYQGNEWSDVNEVPSTRLYTWKSNLDRSIENVFKPEMKEVYGYEVTREQVDKILELFPYAELRKNKYVEIRKIIEEELPAYLNGGKDLDEVCNVIQSRAQLYLDENEG